MKNSSFLYVTLVENKNVGEKEFLFVQSRDRGARHIYEYLRLSLVNLLRWRADTWTYPQLLWWPAKLSNVHQQYLTLSSMPFPHDVSSCQALSQAGHPMSESVDRLI